MNNFGFAILDFRLGEKPHASNCFEANFQSYSGNLKSKIQNRKWVGIFAFALAFVLGGPAAEAQQPKKLTLIGYLSSSDAASESARFEAIRRALRERGHMEGQNIAFEHRYADGKLDGLPELAAELVRLKVDIILVGGDIPIRAATSATKTIPIVMTGAGADPVEAGFIESLARPGGNVTGITNLNRELGAKRLELLKETVSKLARVAVLYDPAIPSTVIEVKEYLPAAAQALRLTIQPWEVREASGSRRYSSRWESSAPMGSMCPRVG